MHRAILSGLVLAIITIAAWSSASTSPTTPVVNAGPDITILVNEPAALQGTATGFFDGLQVDGRASVRWTFGYGGWTYEGTAIGPVAYPEAGTFTATLTACDEAGSCASDSATVTVNAIPEGTETVLADSGNPVTNMANLQAQVDSKASATNPVITLPLGFVARGTLFLRHRTVANYMTIRTAGHASLPNGTTRVSPSDASNMAVLEQSVSDMIIDTPAPSSTPPRYYRFLGIRLRKSNPALDYTHSFVQLGQTGATALNQLPDHIQFDRCFFDGGDTTSNTLRGIMLRANDSSVVNSYFYRFKGVGIEVQAILTVAGERQAFMNNFLQASTENYMSGGTSPSITNHVPTDVVFRRNYLKKDPCWRPADPCYYGVNMSIKNLYEIKFGARYSIQGNIFEKHWIEDQPGYGIVMTVRNDEGNAPWVQIRYIDFAYNKVIETSRGLNVFGNDEGHVSLVTNHVLIRHNIWVGINWTGTDVSNLFIFPGGSIAGPDRLWVVNNSSDVNGDLAFGFGRMINFETGATMTNFVFSGNIGQGYFAGSGGTGTAAINFATNGSYSAVKNGFYRSNGTNPPGNTTVATLADVKYTDVANFNLLLANDSPFLTTGFSGGRSGADITTLNSLTSGTVTGNWGTPAATVSITGTVALSGAALPTVTVQLLRASDRVLLSQFTTGAAGTYILSPTLGSSVIVSPVRAGYSFVPSEVLYSTITENKAQNFAAAAPSPTPTPTVTPTPTPSPTPTPTPTPTPSPTPSPTPTPLPLCAPNQIVMNPPVCKCTTRLIGNPKRCKPR